jgi:hypothetical protein
MAGRTNRFVGILLVFAGVSSALIAQGAGDSAVPNWTVPPYTRAAEP